MSPDKNLYVPDFKKIKSILDSIDWGFSSPFVVGRSGIKLFDIRKHYPYFATFIPEIPYTLIEILTQPKAVVYDPFAGIGTATFQALLLDRTAYASDVNSVAIEIMKAMWVLLNPQINLSHISDYAKRICLSYNPKIDYSRMLDGYSVLIESLRPWYSPKTFNQLMYLAKCQADCTDPGSIAALSIVMPATLKSVCAQNSGWGYIADNVYPDEDALSRPRDAIKRVEQRLNGLVRDVMEARKQLPETTRKLLTEADVDTYIQRIDVSENTHVSERSVDLIVTSPPYPNMTDYALSQRLTYYWLGREPNEDLNYEIGARRRRQRKGALCEYICRMKKAMHVVSRTAKPGSYVCLIMPNYNGEKYNNVARKEAINNVLMELHSLNFEQTYKVTRTLPDLRRHHPLRQQHHKHGATLRQEDVFIYRKS